MQTLTLKAPAKLNLYLQVLNKRPDGFHNIETVFEKIDLCDKITLRKRPQGIKLICRHQGVPTNRANLGWRAAELIFARAARFPGVEIFIQKRIPVAAGLGGGSSDAASVLVGINRLFSLGLSRQELLELGKQLGADVPFFLSPDCRAIGRGKGERLTPLKAGQKNWYVLVLPRALKVSTRQMYQDPRLALTKQPLDVKIILQALEKGDLTALSKYSYNSFEAVLSKRYKDILNIKKALQSSGAALTSLSGSGPCFFGMSKTRKEAVRLKRKLQAKKNNWQVIVTKTLN